MNVWTFHAEKVLVSISIKVVFNYLLSGFRVTKYSNPNPNFDHFSNDFFLIFGSKRFDKAQYLNNSGSEYLLEYQCLITAMWKGYQSRVVQPLPLPLAF